MMLQNFTQIGAEHQRSTITNLILDTLYGIFLCQVTYIYELKYMN